MSWLIPGMERIEPAREYVEHINYVGGLNRFNQPNFKIVWGQNETDVVYGSDENGRTGRHIILKHGGVPAWFIDCWKPPECFGTPEVWYALTWDWELDVPKIGEYPSRGLYMPAPFNLFVKKVENNVLTFDAMPMTHWLIDLLVPNLLKEQESTFLQRKTAIQNRMLAERQRAAQIAFDCYLDARPAFGGAAGTYESNRERWMQRVKEKQANMRISRDQIVSKMGLGHRQLKHIVK